MNSIGIDGQSTGGTPPEADATVQPPRQHVVAAGETLSTIAAQYDLHSGSLVLANSDLENTELLHIGQILVIPDQDASPEALDAEKQQREAKLAATSKKKTIISKKGGSATLATVMSTDDNTSGTKLTTPIHYRYISQYFAQHGHTGVDLVASTGTPVYAAADGCIIHQASGWNGGYGNVIILDIGNGLTTLYGHLSSFEKDNGDCVSAGELIAHSGSTGNSTGPHLHFEVRVNGKAVDPQKYL